MNTTQPSLTIPRDDDAARFALTGRWTLEAAESGATRLGYAWQVELHRPWMRALNGLVRPVFAWNHFVVMRASARGMAEALGCEMRDLEEDSGAERR